MRHFLFHRSKALSSLLLYWLLAISSYWGCQEENNQLQAVTVAEFAAFVEATGYITDAEQFGWSIVQIDVYNFEVIDSVDWRLPNGVDSSTPNMPITQVSYNDALAYCQWARRRLPTYEEYWKIVAHDERPIISSTTFIHPVPEVNTVGNVWDITSTENMRGDIRLAGGSYLCSSNTCHGTVPDRILFVDKQTGNIHIGFSVLPL